MLVKPKRIRILGVPVDQVSMNEAVDSAERLIEQRKSLSIIAINPEKVVAAMSNRNLLKAIEKSGLLIPDGIGIVWASAILKLGRMSRVPGSELMPLLCSRAVKKGYSIYLFGGTPEVNRKAITVISEKYPGIKIVGASHGYLSENEQMTLIKEINEKSPDILFVALGSPRQELWLSESLPRLKIGIAQGVGGTFDVLVGRVSRAPLFFRKINLEWFFRLISQPARLSRQRALPYFAIKILGQWLSSKKQ